MPCTTLCILHILLSIILFDNTESGVLFLTDEAHNEIIPFKIFLIQKLKGTLTLKGSKVLLAHSYRFSNSSVQVLLL